MNKRFVLFFLLLISCQHVLSVGQDGGDTSGDLEVSRERTGSGEAFLPGFRFVNVSPNQIVQERQTICCFSAIAGTLVVATFAATAYFLSVVVTHSQPIAIL